MDSNETEVCDECDKEDPQKHRTIVPILKYGGYVVMVATNGSMHAALASTKKMFCRYQIGYAWLALKIGICKDLFIYSCVIFLFVTTAFVLFFLFLTVFVPLIHLAIFINFPKYTFVENQRQNSLKLNQVSWYHVLFIELSGIMCSCILKFEYRGILIFYMMRGIYRVLFSKKYKPDYANLRSARTFWTNSLAYYCL